MQQIRDTGSIHRLGRCPGGGHDSSLQCSCLENPMDRGAWWAMVHRVAKSWMLLKRLSAQHSCDRQGDSFSIPDSPHPTPDIHVIIPYTAKGIVQMGLRKGPRDGETLLDYPGGSDKNSQKEIQRCYTAGLKDGGRDHKPRDVGSPSMLKETEKGTPLELPEGTQPC